MVFRKGQPVPGSNAGKGLKPGARNRTPQSLQELVVMAGHVSGKPQWRWVQARDSRNRPMWQRDPKTGKTIIDNKTGRRIPVLVRERYWDGSDGILGYLAYLAQEQPQIYAPIFRAVLPHNIHVGLFMDTSEQNAQGQRTLSDLRAELERRGIPVDYLLQEMLNLAPAGRGTAKKRIKLLGSDKRYAGSNNNENGEIDQVAEEADEEADDYGDEDRYR